MKEILIVVTLFLLVGTVEAQVDALATTSEAAKATLEESRFSIEGDVIYFEGTEVASITKDRNVLLLRSGEILIVERTSSGDDEYSVIDLANHVVYGDVTSQAAPLRMWTQKGWKDHDGSGHPPVTSGFKGAEVMIGQDMSDSEVLQRYAFALPFWNLAEQSFGFGGKNVRISYSKSYIVVTISDRVLPAGYEIKLAYPLF